MTAPTSLEEIADGLVAVVRSSCPMCVTVASGARRAGVGSLVDGHQPGRPGGSRGGVESVVLDQDLHLSWLLGIETVPTLLRVADSASRPERSAGTS